MTSVARMFRVLQLILPRRHGVTLRLLALMLCRHHASTFSALAGRPTSLRPSLHSIQPHKPPYDERTHPHACRCEFDTIDRHSCEPTNQFSVPEIEFQNGLMNFEVGL
jgi:hypothetical protein